MLSGYCKTHHSQHSQHSQHGSGGFGIAVNAVGILDCLARQSAFWIAPFAEQNFRLVWQDSLHLHKILSQMDLCITHCQK
jgi:hypothetical protein